MKKYDNTKYKFSEYQGKDHPIHLPDPNCKGSSKVQFPINVTTDFEQLKAVVIGYMDKTANMPEENVVFEPGSKHEGPYPVEIIKKCQEIQEIFAEKLIKRGIEVVRIGMFDFQKKFTIQGYETAGFHAFNARDLYLYYHNSVYECPTFQVSRQTECNASNWIFDQQRNLGSKWYKSYTGIPPVLDYAKLRRNQGYTGNDDDLDPNYPFFDAANLIRIGLDILFLISESGNEEGYSLFRSTLEKSYGSKVRVHPVRNVYNSVHIDTCFTVLGWNKKLQKNLVMVLPKICTKEKIKNFPAIFRGKNWALVEAQGLVNYETSYGIENVSPDELGNNFFVINPDLVVVEEKQVELMKTLNFYGIETISTPNPHGREVFGAIHCMTCDYNREDPKEIGKVLEEKDLSKLSKNDLAGYFDPELLEFLSSKGDISDWVDICNENGIEPKFVTDHLKQ